MMHYDDICNDLIFTRGFEFEGDIQRLTVVDKTDRVSIELT